MGTRPGWWGDSVPLLWAVFSKEAEFQELLMERRKRPWDVGDIISHERKQRGTKRIQRGGTRLKYRAKGMN